MSTNQFSKFRIAIDTRLAAISAGELHRVNVTKEELWETYLGSFAEGDNPIFQERTEHDCVTCRHFIRDVGAVVRITDGGLGVETIWDVQVGGIYQPVADAMAELVRSRPIQDLFLHYEQEVGVDHNHGTVNGKVVKFEHLHHRLAVQHVRDKPAIPTLLGRVRDRKNTALRSLQEITVEACEMVLDLVAQNSLYRGQEMAPSVRYFLRNKKEFMKISGELERDRFAWTVPGVVGIRGTSIGTLLCNLSEGMDLETAVSKYEAMVAPQNYKRTSALVTKTMVKKAQEKVAELGLEDSLQRRHARVEDLTINSILFANRSTRKAMDAFDELVQSLPAKAPGLEKVEEVPAARFIEEILPRAKELQVMVENSHSGNLMSLLAPVHAEAQPLLKWGNNFSWTYNGDVTDSIKEKVKRAGGSVSGALRFSLAWDNTDDLDLHVREPDGTHIYFANGHSRTSSGELDVDANSGNGELTRTPVENITWRTRNTMQEGHYKVWVRQYHRRENKDFGFTMEMDFEGAVQTFHYPDRVSHDVSVMEFDFSRSNGITNLKGMTSADTSKEVWGINTHTFEEVAMVLDSPNHWEDKAGNQHLFFILEKCRNPDPVRGFFNEFLRADLREHRKVFEVLGARMMAEHSERQLSGLGFSTTLRNHVLCKVGGSVNRIIKVTF